MPPMGIPRLSAHCPRANVTPLLLGTYSMLSLMQDALHMVFHLILKSPYEVNGTKTQRCLLFKSLHQEVTARIQA